MKEEREVVASVVPFFILVAAASIVFSFCGCAALKGQWNYDGDPPCPRGSVCVGKIRHEGAQPVVDCVNTSDWTMTVTLACAASLDPKLPRIYPTFDVPPNKGQTFMALDDDAIDPCKVKYHTAPQ